MDFRQTIVAAVCRAITDHIKLSESDVCFTTLLGDTQGNVWPRDFLRGLFETDLIKMYELTTAISEGIILWGQKMYDQVCAGQYPDHVASPAALAYAMKQQRVPCQEAVFQRLDHGETPAQFLARADGLVDWAIARMLR